MQKIDNDQLLWPVDKHDVMLTLTGIAEVFDQVRINQNTTIARWSLSIGKRLTFLNQILGINQGLTLTKILHGPFGNVMQGSVRLSGQDPAL